MNAITRLADKNDHKFNFGFTLLAVIPIGMWAISTLFIPLFSNNLSQANNWAVTLTIVLLMGASLLCHASAHLFVARIGHNKTPRPVAIFIFGDTAQSWPMAASARDEALIASAGPLTSILLSLLAYLVWNTHINTFLDLTAFFIFGFNGWLFVINLLPAFPMDGGRIMRAGMQGLINPPAAVTVLIRQIGITITLALAVWGIILYLQNSGFGSQTALITFALVVLLMDGLRIQPAFESETTAHDELDLKSRWLRLPGLLLLALIMLGAFSATLMTDSGLEAPGAGISVEPMVNVPAQYHHTHDGTFILTTLSIHSPIFAGEWMEAELDPTKLVVTPKNLSAQELTRQDHQLLEDSKATAITVGLHLAGYPFEIPVSIVTQKISGGSSAGLMFTLAVDNVLSAQDLTGGRKIAGTGTINLDGTVGPIGGVKQKVAAAEATGARYFLCPVVNYADAVSVARTIKVIKVGTVQDALDFLHSLP